MVKNNLIIKNFHKYFILIIKKQIDLKKKISILIPNPNTWRSLKSKCYCLWGERCCVQIYPIWFSFPFFLLLIMRNNCNINLKIQFVKHDLVLHLLPTASFFNYFKSKNDITKKSGSISLPYTPDKITCNQLITVNYLSSITSMYLFLIIKIQF